MSRRKLPAEEVEAIWAEMRRMRELVARGDPSALREGMPEGDAPRFKRAMRLLSSALAVREAHHAAILESATDFAIVATDMAGRITTWNEGAHRILGWSEEEMLGERAALIFTTEDREAGIPEREMACAIENGRAIDERWHQRHDGSRFWASGLLMPLRVGEDTLGFLKILRDRTAEHEREARERRTEERLRLALMATPAVGVWEWDLAQDLVFADANFAAIYGVPGEEAAAGAALATFTRNIHPDDLPGFRAAIERTRERREPFAYEYRLLQADGSWCWVLARGGLVGDASGNFVRFSGVTLDITDRKRAELRQAALIELGDRFRDIANPTGITTAAVEALGRTLEVARAGYGTTHEDGEHVDMEHDWTAPGQASVAGSHRFADYGAFLDDLRDGRLVIVEDVLADGRTRGQPDQWRSIGIRALVNVPILEHGRLVAILFLIDSRPRRWSAEEVQFVRDVGQRTREAVERRRAEDAQRLLAGELQHRVKNTLAMVQAIASQTFRDASSAQARDTFANRLLALAQANDVLRGAGLTAASVHDVVTGATVPHCAGPERFTVTGPALEVAARAALALTLALHELCTNAAKYGALSTEQGHVTIEWGVEHHATLRLSWRERGGPSVRAPARTGFGTRLIERSLAGQLGGRVDTAYDPDGVTCTIELPISAVQEAA